MRPPRRADSTRHSVTAFLALCALHGCVGRAAVSQREPDAIYLNAHIVTGDAAAQAREIAAQLDKVTGGDVAALKAQAAALVPPQPAGGGGAGGRGGGGGGRGRGGNAAAAATLDGVRAQMLATAMAMQGADEAPTGREVAACAAARRQSVEVMARWAKIKAAYQTMKKCARASRQSSVKSSVVSRSRSRQSPSRQSPSLLVRCGFQAVYGSRQI